MPLIIPILLIGAGGGLVAWWGYSASQTAGQVAGQGISDAALVIGLAVAASVVIYTLKQPGTIKA